MESKYDDRLNNYSRNIYRFRKIYGLTQQQLADMIGVERSTLAKMENGKNRGTLETLLAFADVFGISPDSFFETDNTYMQVCVNIETKKRFEQFCENVGISPETAVSMFVKATLRQNKIPFEISADMK